MCSRGRPGRYRRISSPTAEDTGEFSLPPEDLSGRLSGYETDSDLVSLKISILGDCQIGKTSFVVKLLLDLKIYAFIDACSVCCHFLALFCGTVSFHVLCLIKGDGYLFFFSCCFNFRSSMWVLSKKEEACKWKD